MNVLVLIFKCLTAKVQLGCLQVIQTQTSDPNPVSGLLSLSGVQVSVTVLT